MASKLRNNIRHLVILFFLLHCSLSEASSHVGFSAQIIHRDSPLSPLGNNGQTHLERLAEATRRGLARSYSSITPSSIRSTTSPNTADHLMKFSIGTPPVEILGVMDSGSDLVWARCKPCVDCNGRQVPFFDPGRSSTYQNITCNDPRCNDLDPNACSKGPNCPYMYGYGDGSFTAGVIGTETFTFDSTEGTPVSFPGFEFGCGHNNSMSFVGKFIGLVGLGGRSSSLISQLSPSTQGKFSYCLVPFHENTSTSVMNFGDHAVLSGPNVVSTPLVDGPDQTYRYVNLESVSVGGTKFEVPRPRAKVSDDTAAAGVAANMFIDCGTTVTLLEDSVFKKLSAELTRAVKLPPTTDPGKTFLCYRATSRDNFPAITFHFAGGADLVMSSFNSYTPPSPDGLVCLAMQATNGTAVFGNQVQQNFQVAYDLVEKKVSFAPADCSNISN